MTWAVHHRRNEVLRASLAIADRHPADRTAAELLDHVAGARAAFPTEVDLLLAVQMNWQQRLSGQLDRRFDAHPDRAAESAVAAWVATARAMPGARALLDRHRGLAALRPALDKEAELLALSAGVPARHRDLVAHGERLIALAAARAADRPLPAAGPGGLLARIRGVLVA